MLITPALFFLCIDFLKSLVSAEFFECFSCSSARSVLGQTSIADSLYRFQFQLLHPGLLTILPVC